MWVIGILSQILLQNLYFSVIKVRNEEKMAMEEDEDEDPLQGINLEEVEAIDDVQNQLDGTDRDDNDRVDDNESAATFSPSNQDVRG